MIDVNKLEGALVYDSEGAKIGRVYDLFVDDRTSRPEWLLVDSSGVNPDRIIPITGVREHEDGILVPFAKRLVDHAPRINWTYGLSERDERRLYEHYEIPFGSCSDATEPCSDSLLPRQDAAATREPGLDTKLGPQMTDEERSESYRLVLMRQAVGRVPHGSHENVIGERHVA